jgi:hypothetical protein
MFEHFARYPWVLEIMEYTDIDDIKSNVLDKIIDACEARIAILRK